MGLLYDVYQKREGNKKKRSCETGLKQKKRNSTACNYQITARLNSFIEALPANKTLTRLSTEKTGENIEENFDGDSPREFHFINLLISRQSPARLDAPSKADHRSRSRARRQRHFSFSAETGGSAQRERN